MRYACASPRPIIRLSSSLFSSYTSSSSLYFVRAPTYLTSRLVNAEGS